MDELIISAAELRALPVYDVSLPTGTTIGKRWRRDGNYRNVYHRKPGAESEWIIGEYVEHPDPDKVGIVWRWACSEPGCVHRGDLAAVLAGGEE